jgi:hypothetical protein
MIPLIQKKFGENLIALAASASYARNEDSDYSDLELNAFVKALPEGQRRGGMGKIREGMLVELVWTTRENYLEDLQTITDHWYIAASDTLVSLINPKFIEELNDYQIENLKGKCLARAVNRWHDVQEATAKVVNAILASNRDGIPLLVFDMALHMLIVLSFLNQIPYVTFARFIAKARTFPVKPAAFEALLDILVQGTYQDLPRLEEVVTAVFSQFETIFEALGIELYDNNVDPNQT